MSKKGAKPKTPEVEAGPAKIELFPPQFIANLERRLKESDFNSTDPPSIDEFLEQLLDSPDSKYNHFKLWMHRLVRRMRAQLQLQDATDLVDQHEYAILLWLNLLVDFVRNTGLTAAAGLDEFWAYVNQNQATMFTDFQTFGWFCLLSVLDRKKTSLTNSKISLRPSKHSSKASTSSAKISITPSRRSKTSSSSTSALGQFQLQLKVLMDLLRAEFTCGFHMELLRQAICVERVWDEFVSDTHRLNVARPCMGKEPKKKATSTPGKLTEPPQTPRSGDGDGVVVDADPEGMAVAVVVLTPEQQVIMPLNMATDKGDNFWAMMFPTKE